MNSAKTDIFEDEIDEKWERPKKKKARNIFVGIPKRSGALRDVFLREKAILKCILNKQYKRVKWDYVGQEYDQ